MCNVVIPHKATAVATDKGQLFSSDITTLSFTCKPQIQWLSVACIWLIEHMDKPGQIRGHMDREINITAKQDRPYAAGCYLTYILLTLQQ